ncbi:hypothetical protein BHE74_00050785, partial [Ensete ventricosum]
ILFIYAYTDRYSQSLVKHRLVCSQASKEGDELDQPKDASLQRNHGPLHARLVGALPLQYPSLSTSPYFFSLLRLTAEEGITLLLLLSSVHQLNVVLYACFRAVCGSLTLADVLMLTSLWFICYNGSRFATEFYEGGHLKYKLLVDGRFPNGGSIPPS